jgi:YD repeat-containing protein
VLEVLAGRRTRPTHPDGFDVDYDYLVTGEMAHIRENGASSGVRVLATYAYDDLGRRASVTYGDGSTTSYSYDGVSRLTQQVLDLAGTAYDLTLGFTYNPPGRSSPTRARTTPMPGTAITMSTAATRPPASISTAPSRA